jgi:hypothetical protein
MSLKIISSSYSLTGTCPNREIIDESDVFVDVHEARKRSTAAPIFKLRRSSTAKSSKHQSSKLGPSNLASKPTQTRHNNIKIKPGAVVSKDAVKNLTAAEGGGFGNVEWTSSAQGAGAGQNGASGADEREVDETAPLLDRT